MSKSTGTCQYCGSTVIRRSDRGVVPAYCEAPECYRRCSVASCDGWGRTKGYCGTHYSRYRKHGDPLGGPIYGSNAGKVCAAEGCDSEAVTRGYCHPHYERFRRYGEPLAGKARNLGACKVQTCDEQAVCRDWCRKHYGRWVAHGDPLHDSAAERPTSCTVQGCEREHRASGYCKRHYYRLLRYGNAEYVFPDRYCHLCGDLVKPGLHKNFCGATCYRTFEAFDGAPPLVGTCTVCATEIEFLTTGSNGRKRYRRRRWCWDCKLRARSAPHALTVDQLELRDGPTCRICRVEIDMTVRGRIPLAPSVDHIAPLSRGGLNVPENLQLSHLICNVRKNDRVIV